MARTVRSKFFSIKKEDYIMSARISGAPGSAIVMRHMIPSFLSYIIVRMSLTIPQLIVGETTLSFFRSRSPFPRDELGRPSAGNK